jgi:hypothetical protein
MVPVLAASCGGSAPPAQTGASHTVAGPGFTFAVPERWKATPAGSAVVARPPGDKSGTLVSATEYRLVQPYSPTLFILAAKELDGVAAKLARASGGTLTESVTTTVDGRKIRAYRFTSHPVGKPSTDTRIGFVLEGRREFQLLCQAPPGSGDPDGACALLFATFAARLE